MSPAPVHVLVVGAGPSGLFAAIELARHGIRARVVERLPEPHREARATALQPGTLELLDQAGIVDQVLAASEHLPYARVFDAELKVMSELAFAGAGCRWEFQASLPQYLTEQILSERLAELGVQVERGVTVSSLDASEGEVVVGLERSDGTRETTRAEGVIGAGGARSVTRKSMGETLIGETYPGTALAADIRLRCGVPRDNAALVATPRGYVLLGPLPDDRWITFVGDLEDDEVERFSTDTSIEAVAASIERRITGEVQLQDVAWASPFQMHRRAASRLAGRRRFLLGDAGHLSSPFGGEGLNSGLHDGHNLAWKLALVLCGRGRECLIDSFASERFAADQHALKVSDELHGLAHAAVEAARTGARPAPPTADQVKALVRSRSMLDVSYAGSPLVGEHVADGEETLDGISPGERYPAREDLGTSHRLLLFGAASDEDLARLRDRWRGLVDVIDATGADSAGRGTVLVRPDGYVGFCAPTSDGSALRAVDAHLDSYLVPA